MVNARLSQLKCYITMKIKDNNNHVDCAFTCKLVIDMNVIYMSFND